MSPAIDHGPRVRNGVSRKAARLAIGASPAVFWLFAVPQEFAQNPSRSIEVASIRTASFPNESYFLGFTSAGGVCSNGARPLAISGNKLRLPRVSLCQLIGLAYDVQDYRIVGAPSWMLKVEQSNYYDVQLKAAGDEVLTEEQGRALLRMLLADRFQLRAHVDTKTVRVYELLIAKNGSKLGEVPAGDSARSGVSMRSYVSFISNYVDRPVVDKTGLTGTHYQFKFDQTELRKELSEGIKPVPSIFHEVEQQLGLTLRVANSPVDVIVIDNAERASDN